MSDPRPDGLRLPVSQGAQLVTRAYLAQAAQAAERLTTSRDADALHDFRVALRRLRSWTRAFREELHPAVRARDLRALRDIARATNAGRDAEVQLEWLHGVGGMLSRRRREGVNWMSDFLEARKALADEVVLAQVAPRFAKVERRMVERLARQDDREEEGASMPLGAAIAARLQPHHDAMRDALDAVHGVGDEARAHEARIQAKRLRYLLEPAVATVAGGPSLLGHLKQLQDELGTLHDAHVLALELRLVVERSAALAASRDFARHMGPDGTELFAARDEFAELREPAPRAPLLALASHLRAHMSRAYRVVDRHWLGGRHARIDRELATFAERLRQAMAA